MMSDQKHEDLSKSIGFITFPHFGVDRVPTQPYTAASLFHTVTAGNIRKPAVQTSGSLPVSSLQGVAGGPVGYKLEGKEGKGVIKAYARPGATEFPNGTISHIGVEAIAPHEAQHTVFLKLGQTHGHGVARGLARHLFESLDERERLALTAIASRSGYYNEEHYNKGRRMPAHPAFHEEAICTLQNYLNSPDWREAVHADLSASEEGAWAPTHEKWKVESPERRALREKYRLPRTDWDAQNLHDTAKRAWKKLVAAAKGVKPGSFVMKSEGLNKALLGQRPSGVYKKQHDYSHLLDQSHKEQGYKLYVTSEDVSGPGEEGVFEVVSGLSDGEVQLGYVRGTHYGDEFAINASDLDQSHRNKGLGVNLYEAAIAHAAHEHGAKKVSGEDPSPEAQRVHSSLARRHGMEYGLNRHGHYYYTIKKEPSLTRTDKKIRKSEDGSPVKVASIAVFNKDGEMLWGQRNDTDLWTMPGGHFERGETPLKAAVRELYEETGLKPEDMDYLGEKTVTSRDGKEITVYSYKAVCDGEPTCENDPDGELDEWEWVDVSDGIPGHIMDRLHAPKNVTLQFLGMQDKGLSKNDTPEFHKQESNSSQAHPHDNEVWWEDVAPLELAKGQKDALAMYKPEHPGFATAKEHVAWTYSKMPNENWAFWAVRHHRQDPAAFTPQIKQKIEHFAGSQHIPEVAGVRFDKTHDLHHGLSLLEEAEKRYIDRKKSSLSLASKPQTAKKLIDFGDGTAWWDLGKSSCSEEGKAMGHCGNVPSQQRGDSVLSFRTEHVLGGKKYYEPHLTFIRNGNVLGEMKGRGNQKPAKQYHEKIVSLLNKGYAPLGGGYLPENNFQLKDLSPELMGQVDPSVRNAGADYGSASKFTYADGKRPFVQAIAANPNLDPQHHGLLARDADWSVRRAIAANPNLDPQHHGLLAQDADKFVRRAIAANPNLDPQHHGLLARDANSAVRWAIAANPNLDPQHHGLLAQDADKFVRQAIAENPNLDPQHHGLLAQDADADVCQAIAANPNLDPQHHGLLAQDADEAVRRAIAENPNLDPQHHGLLARDADADVRRAIAANPNLDPQHHGLLAQDADKFVRRAIAANPNLDPQHHGLLARDADWSVRRAIAENPNLDPQHHGLLARSESWWNTLSHLRKSQSHWNTPEFQSWFDGSHVTEDGKPLVVYRGTQRPQIDGRLVSPSFTDSKDVASIYSASPDSLRHEEGASVYPVYLSIKNPVKLPWHNCSFGDILRALKYGEGGIEHEEAVDILKHMANRKTAMDRPFGKLESLAKLGDYRYKVLDEDGDEEEGDFGDLLRGKHPIHTFKEDFDSWGMDVADRLVADTYAFVDAPAFVRAAQKNGHDGVYHHDILQHEKAIKKLTGKDFEGENEEPHKMWTDFDELDEDLGEVPVHGTWRPFHSAQVKSVFNGGSHSPGTEDMSKAEAPLLKTDPETLEYFRQELLASFSVRRRAAVRHPNFPPTLFPEVLKDEDRYVRMAAIKHPNFPPALLPEAFKDEDRYVRMAAIQHPNFPPALFPEALKDEAFGVREAAIQHPNFPPALFPEALKDEDFDVRETAKKVHATHFPDSYHKESIDVKHLSGKHRALRDRILATGQTQVHPRDLGPGDYAHFRSPSGHVSADRIQEYIDKMPSIRYNVSHDVWEGVQRHSTEKSNVLQLNVTDDLIKKMKEAGVHQTFRNVLEASNRSGHPVHPTYGLGWVRYTGDKDQGYFIDEVQSDFGQSLVRQAAAQAAQAGHDVAEATARAKAKWPDEHLQKIQEIVFGGKHPNEVLHEAFRQHIRNKGEHDAKIAIHHVDTKAPISGWKTDKDFPVHAQRTYRQYPEKIGMNPSTYGTLPTQKSKDLKGQKTYEDTIRKFESLSKSLSDIPVGTRIDLGDTKIVHHEHLDDVSEIKDARSFDYNHTLKQEMADRGFRLIVSELRRHGHAPDDAVEIYSQVHEPSRSHAVGHVKAYFYPKTKNLQIPYAEISKKELHGKGLGPSMYEAVMAHAKNVLGAVNVSGGIHSSMASRVHSKLADKHDMEYWPQENYGTGDTMDEPEDEEGPFDNHYAPYSYNLKAEPSMSKEP